LRFGVKHLHPEHPGRQRYRGRPRSISEDFAWQVFIIQSRTSMRAINTIGLASKTKTKSFWGILYSKVSES